MSIATVECRPMPKGCVGVCLNHTSDTLPPSPLPGPLQRWDDDKELEFVRGEDGDGELCVGIIARETRSGLSWKRAGRVAINAWSAVDYDAARAIYCPGGDR
jgi:hypothetical protein